MIRVGYLGPPGTFTEEALLSQADLADQHLVEFPTWPEVLEATAAGEVDLGFVAVENAIEGTVTETVDALVFDHELVFQREVVFAIRQHLLAPAGLGVDDVQHIASYPVATAQCRRFLHDRLPGRHHVAATSTSEAVRMVAAGECPPATAAIGTALAAKLYDLEVLAQDIEDHPDNATRFVVAAPLAGGVPPPTGHDRTSIVCFQRQNEPGSLHAILGQFSARGIDLTKLESRPTKTGLGDYCFLIDLVGHIADEVIADCLRELHIALADVKFLGSYPAAGEQGHQIRAEAQAAYAKADGWIRGLQDRIRR